MAADNAQNDFLLELLKFQQDGRNSISAPTNWAAQPLLEVRTETDNLLDELEEAILLRGEDKDCARWHFFIGSPGNGKSAAMGKLCRRLSKYSKGCEVVDERGVELANLEPGTIPYEIKVYEGDNKFASAQIVQDASVVRNPFDPNIDPAEEMVKTIKDAWGKGISLIVCTNRGVIEKAHRDYHTDREVNSRPWFKVLANTALSRKKDKLYDFEGKKSVFSQVKVTYSDLDNRSLLLGRDTFDQLLSNSTKKEHWEVCDGCHVVDMCPFKANRDWLVNGTGRTHVLNLLKRAEVFSGQVIVFREALALISYILSGCPRDYNAMHPCKWVQNSFECNDIFSLAARRIYMCLFASYCPHGLETEVSLRKRQLKALDWVIKDTSIINENHGRQALSHVAKHKAPSTDVGITRLLSEKGMLAELDPCRESMPYEFYERWDIDSDKIDSTEGELITKIESDCISTWRNLEECLESAVQHSVSESHWALRRWSSNFLLHLGALLEGRSAWKNELDEFADLISIAAKPPEERSLDDKVRIREIDKRLESLLNAVPTDQNMSTLQLSEAVTLTGQWVQRQLKPKTIYAENTGSLSLAIEFEGGEQSVFTAPMYLWLTRRTEGKLDFRCFPQKLLSGVTDARVRAASKGKYAFENNEIELIVYTSEGERFRLTRIDGMVVVNNE